MNADPNARHICTVPHWAVYLDMRPGPGSTMHPVSTWDTEAEAGAAKARYEVEWAQWEGHEIRVVQVCPFEWLGMRYWGVCAGRDAVLSRAAPGSGRIRVGKVTTEELG